MLDEDSGPGPRSAGVVALEPRRLARGSETRSGRRARGCRAPIAQIIRSNGSRPRSWGRAVREMPCREFPGPPVRAGIPRPCSAGAGLIHIPYPAGPISDPDDPGTVHQFRKESGHVVFQSKAGDAVHAAVLAYAFGSRDHYVSLVGARDDQGRPYIMPTLAVSGRSDSGWVRTTGHSALAADTAPSL